MTSHLALRPERCDRCGKCIAACSRGLVRVGGGYVHVDAAECDSCFECVAACGRGAILKATGPRGGVLDADGPKVLVGSRAEAKALRASAKAAASAKARGESRAADATGGAQWSAMDGAVVGFVLLVALLAKQAVLESAPVQVMPDSSHVVVRGVVLLVFYSAQLAVLGFLARRRGFRFAEAFRLRPAERDPRGMIGVATDAALVVGLLVLTRVVSTAWGAVAQAIGWAPPTSGADSLVEVFGSGSAGLSLAVLMAVTLGPFAEELAFRGVIAGAARGLWGRRAAIVVSAALFGFYHLTPWSFVPMFALGCALGWLAVSRRSLWPAIALHALYNGIVVGAAFWLAR